jgi:tetratricopeptide (TPR) repeat protein
VEDALQSFDAALKIEPEEVGTLHSKGLALYRLGKFDEALEIYDRVLALRTDAYDTLANKALVLAELHRSDEAIKVANRALTLAPQTNERAMLFVIRAKVSYLISRLKDVAPDIVKAWRLNPDLVLAVRECHSLFIESFDATDSPSEDEAILYAQLNKEASNALATAAFSVSSE